MTIYQEKNSDTPEIRNTLEDEGPATEVNRDVLTAAKGGGISFLGKLFEYAVRFVFSIIVARSIGVEQFGLYTIGLTVTSILAMISMLGMQTGMVRYLPPFIRQRDNPKIWGVIQVGGGLTMLLSLALMAGVYLLAEPLAVYGFKDPRLVPVFHLICLSIPLDALTSIGYVVIISYKQPKYNVLANNIVLPLVKLGLTVVLLLAGLGTMGVLTAHVVAAAAGFAVTVYFVNYFFPLIRPIQSAQRNTRQLLKYSLPAYLGWVINTVRGTLETLVLGIVGLTAGVGVYSAALRLSMVGNMFYSSIGNISTPIFSDLYSQKKLAQLKTFYQTTTKWLVSFNLPIFLTFVIFARPLLTIFGEDFASGTLGLIILATGTLVYTCTGTGANLLDMTDHTRVNSTNSVIMVIVTIGLDLLLIPRWGVVGAAAASAGSTVLVNIICLLEVLYFLGIHPYNRTFLKPILASLVAGGAAGLFALRVVLPQLLFLAAGIIILWAVYAGILIALKFSAEDMQVFESIQRRLNLRFFNARSTSK